MGKCRIALCRLSWSLVLGSYSLLIWLPHKRSHNVAVFSSARIIKDEGEAGCPLFSAGSPCGAEKHIWYAALASHSFSIVKLLHQDELHKKKGRKRVRENVTFNWRAS